MCPEIVFLNNWISFWSPALGLLQEGCVRLSVQYACQLRVEWLRQAGAEGNRERRESLGFLFSSVPFLGCLQASVARIIASAFQLALPSGRAPLCTQIVWNIGHRANQIVPTNLCMQCVRSRNWDCGGCVDVSHCATSNLWGMFKAMRMRRCWNRIRGQGKTNLLACGMQNDRILKV